MTRRHSSELKEKSLTQSTLVLGGAASGKSAWAEAFLENDGRPMVYLATGRILDDEVAQKVAVHKKRRDARWRTIEAPLELAPQFREAQGPLNIALAQAAALVVQVTAGLPLVLKGHLP